MQRPLLWSATFPRRMLRELLLQSMFQEATRALDLRLPPLFPVGASANYGLLYLIVRIIHENRITRVLDIGAGQSSLLLNALAERSPIEVVTLETHEEWAARIGAQVKHRVLHVPLERKTSFGQSALCYSELSGLEGKFDLIIADAPHGTPRHSRWACLEVIDRFRADEHIVIFDDAERRGERDTIRRFLALESRAPVSGKFFKPAEAQQFVACTPAFSHVFHYKWS